MNNQGKPASPTNDGGLRRIQTFQSDVEELMQRKHVSKAGIAIAENEREAQLEKRPPETPTEPSPRAASPFQIVGGLPQAPRFSLKQAAPYLVALLFLVGAGIGVFFYLTRDEPSERPSDATQAPGAPVITLQGGERRAGTIKAVRSYAGSLSVPQNELRVIPIAIGGVPISTAEFFEMLDTQAPASLVRALSFAPVLGVHGYRGGQPFMLFGVGSYDHAFSGMLAWEKDLLYDVGPLFGVVPRGIVDALASVTPQTLAEPFVVKDIIVRNKDVREVLGPERTLVFLYAFLDKETLVLTTNEETLKFLMSHAEGGRLK